MCLDKAAAVRESLPAEVQEAATITPAPCSETSVQTMQREGGDTS